MWIYLLLPIFHIQLWQLSLDYDTNGAKVPTRFFEGTSTKLRLFIERFIQLRKIVNQSLRIHSAKYVTRRSKKPKIDYFADKIQVLLFTRQTQSHEGLQIFPPPPPNQITISFFLFLILPSNLVNVFC